jgi:hypothetical protein
VQQKGLAICQSLYILNFYLSKLAASSLIDPLDLAYVNSIITLVYVAAAVKGSALFCMNAAYVPAPSVPPHVK